jgi:hypothetical protein
MFDEKTFSEERENTLSGSDLLKVFDSNRRAWVHEY